MANAPKSVRDSITAAFRYFGENAHEIVRIDYESYDYSLYFNDLQNRDVSDEVSVAEVVGLFSALAKRAVLPGLVICGRVVMSGSMMPLTADLTETLVIAANAGAKRIMLPVECKTQYDEIKSKLFDKIEVIFYTTPLDAARKALGVN